MIKTEIGDVILMKGKGFVSFMIRFLQWIRYMIPFREIYSHVMIAKNENESYSAESKGIMVVSHDIIKKGSQVLVYRLAGMTEDRKTRAIRVAENSIGVGYAYARYGMNGALIFSFASFVTAICLLPMAFWASVRWVPFAYFGAGVVFSVIVWILKRSDRQTYDCVEFVSMVLTFLGLWVPLGKDSSVEFPNGMKQCLDMLVLTGHASIVKDPEPERGAGKNA